MQKITSQHRGEIITALVLIIFLAVFVSPPGLLMPKSTEMLILVLFILSYFLYLGFVWKEHALDEREQVHKQISGRISFFAGTTILTIGVMAQALKHNIDPWLIGALGIMLLTKIFVRMYSQHRQ